MKRQVVIWFLPVMLLFPLWAAAQKKQVKEGNRLYQEKKYNEAATAYQEALIKNPSYTPGIFNLGNALLKQQQYDAARQAMENAAAQTNDPTLQSGARYNVGNSFMEEKKWEQAIEAYKKTLRINPQDEAAKYNLSYARAMMQKQENNKDDNQEQDDKEKQENKEQEENQEQEDNKKQQQDGESQKPQPQPSKLTEQQAEQLLNTLAQEEKKLHDKKEEGKGIPVKMDKDW